MDYYGKYLESNFILSENPKDKIACATLHESYEAYCKENGIFYKKKKFIDYCENRFGTPVKNSILYYKCIREKTIEELEKDLEEAVEEEVIQNQQQEKMITFEDLQKENEALKEMVLKLQEQIKELQTKEQPKPEQKEIKKEKTEIKNNPLIFNTSVIKNKTAEEIDEIINNLI